VICFEEFYTVILQGYRNIQGALVTDLFCLTILQTVPYTYDLMLTMMNPTSGNRG